MTPSTPSPFYAMNNAIIKHYMDLYISTVSRYLNLDQGDITIENKKQIEKKINRVMYRYAKALNITNN